MKSRAAQMLVGVALVGCLGSGCRGRAASVEDCRAVLDRLVELELTESGFHDRALAARWTSELRARLAPDLVRCQGKRVPADLRMCLASAHSPEEITHRCLE